MADCPAFPEPDRDRSADPLRFVASRADQLQAVTRTGLFCCTSDYDRERYQRILDIAAEMDSIVFVCEATGGALSRTPEALDLGYFDQAALPELVSHLRRPVEDALAAWRDGWTQAAFDL